MSLAAARLIGLVLSLLVVFFSGWAVRGVKAERDHNQFLLDLAAQAQDQRALKAKVEAANAQRTKESSQRVDAQEQHREVEVRYVDREVVKYVDRYRDRACALPPEWVCLANRSFGLPCAVSDAGTAGR